MWDELRKVVVLSPHPDLVLDGGMPDQPRWDVHVELENQDVRAFGAWPFDIMMAATAAGSRAGVLASWALGFAHMLSRRMRHFTDEDTDSESDGKRS